MTDAIHQFRSALTERGIIPPDDLQADGKLHRCDAEGLHGKGDAAYLLHLDGVSAGGFENHRDGRGWENWRANLDRPMRPEELAAQRAVIEKAQRERAAEISKRQVEAREIAHLVWAEALPCQGHGYLSAKGVSVRGVKVIHDTVLRRYVSISENMSGSLLVIPLRDGSGVLYSLQFIDVNGQKRFLPGGQKRGCYFSIGKPNGTLCIAEGFATGVSILEATGYAVAVAFDAGNLLPVAQALREKLPDARIVLCADDDWKSDGNPGLTKATEAAQAVGGKVAVPVFGESRADGETDFNDMAARLGAEAVKVCVAAALNEPAADCSARHSEAEEPPIPKIEEGEPPAKPGHDKPKKTPSFDTPGDVPEASGPESDDERIAWLAGLPAVTYERVRASEAKRLKVRAPVLDKIVARERQGAEKNEGIGFDEVEPWPHPVAGDVLLTEITAAIARFIICRPETARAAALWVTMTWLIDVVQVAPLAAIVSPEKRCGKSQLLAILGKLSRRPMVASNISPAALFRVIDAWQPTLMIDEADAFVGESEELRGILNSGHTRDSAYVVRTVGEDFTPKQFSTWGAKALAGIGSLADTLMDRSIVLDLRRKLPHENVERLRHAETDLFQMLASRLARWADDHREQVRRARPDLPARLNDRAQDNWEPLLAIADVAGGPWPELARQAALTISGGREEGNLTLGAELLVDIRGVFEKKHAERISTAELIAALIEDDEAPWATYNRGRPISPRQISKRLRDYGITSKNIRVDYAVTKGFEHSQFQDAFLRYLPPPEIIRYAATKSTESSDIRDLSVADSQNACATNDHVSATTLHRGSGDGNVFGVADVADKNGCSGYENSSATRNPSNGKGCSGVADKKGVPGDDDVVEVTI